jgi:hypothetical protein
MNGDESIEPRPDLYEPPAIERVMSPEDLAREIHYAGNEISLDSEAG